VIKNVDADNTGVDGLFYSYAENLESPRKLTVEQLKKYVGFNDISEEKAQEMVDGLYKLSIITYKIFKNGSRTV
jgi:hypothetical protein